MSIAKRRLDIIGKTQTHNYIILNNSKEFKVRLEIVGQKIQKTSCSCETSNCIHINEVLRDLAVARANMVRP